MMSKRPATVRRKNSFNRKKLKQAQGGAGPSEGKEESESELRAEVPQPASTFMLIVLFDKTINLFNALTGFLLCAFYHLS